jgi:CheY-like chemotaxis protein
MILQTWRPDVLLSDIEMPGEDGYSLIAKIRGLSTDGVNLVAVALTAHARPDDRSRALAAGFQWHLAKPIDPGELVSVIAMLTVRADEIDSPA